MKLSSKSASSPQEHPKSSQNTNINRLKNVKLSSKSAFRLQERPKSSQTTTLHRLTNTKLSSTSAFRFLCRLQHHTKTSQQVQIEHLPNVKLSSTSACSLSPSTLHLVLHYSNVNSFNSYCITFLLSPSCYLSPYLRLCLFPCYHSLVAPLPLFQLQSQRCCLLLLSAFGWPLHDDFRISICSVLACYTEARMHSQLHRV